MGDTHMMVVNLMRGVQRGVHSSIRVERVAPRLDPESWTLLDGEGSVVGAVERPAGTPAFGANAPALLLRRDS